MKAFSFAVNPILTYKKADTRYKQKSSALQAVSALPREALLSL
jgi:hypothetical protein